tara:strand:- start:139 stop:525 length:387 start_codon:yes stop_codon:yes gene_type:complete
MKTTLKPNLGNTGFYGAKDQAKSDRATCFIGKGSARSSTHRYMVAWGVLANKGSYEGDEIVLVSAEGARGGRSEPPFDELLKACQAGVRIITDVPAARERSYNVGERQVAEFLASHGYTERRGGQWII